jgi:ferrous iron transport protein B
VTEASAASGIRPTPGPRRLRVAVAGNPNAGKSTLINAIAGTKLHVGNWSGVTVEKKQATFKHGDITLDLVDLPGTYSLSPYSQEEVIAAEYLAEQKPDVIVDVVDATNLERNLYLTVQLLELGIPVVIALNIYDEAEKKGLKIDAARIAQAFGVTVVATSAITGSGLSELLDAITEVASDLGGRAPRKLDYGADLDCAISTIERRLASDHPELGERYPLRWLAIKLLEGDEHVSDRTDLPSSGALVADASGHLRAVHGGDIESMLAEARYAQAAGLTREVLTKPLEGKVEFTERVDKIILNRYLGIPIFLAMMWLLFKVMFDFSSPYVDWFGELVNGPVAHLATAGLTAIGASGWLISLVVDGIIGGVGIVLSFLPIIFTMMFFITLLEASGYMARAAFIMDRSMRAIGLHGKSFIPLLLGFGCNVPAVYATRTLENPKDKVLTSLLIPFMSCGARLPVYVLFTAVFFAKGQATVLWSLYVLGIVVAMLLGLIFKKTLFPGEAPAFVMELPPYRMPSLKSLLSHTWEKGKHYVVKAGTYIVVASVIVWLLYNLPWGTANKQDTYLGRAGAVVAPVLAPLGFGSWQAGSSLIAGIAAKEVVVSTMSQIYAPNAAGATATTGTASEPTFTKEIAGLGTGLVTATRDAVTGVLSGFGVTSLSARTPEEEGSLAAPLREAFTPLSAYAFLVFVLLYVPCMVVIASMRQEFNTWKWPLFSVGVSLTAAWVVSFLIYQAGSILRIGV